MIIERQGRRYFVPDDATALDANGAWTSIPHSQLLPTDIKKLQDQIASARALADQLQAQADAKWQEYIAAMATQGLTLPATAPAYGVATGALILSQLPDPV